MTSRKLGVSRYMPDILYSDPANKFVLFVILKSIIPLCIFFGYFKILCKQQNFCGTLQTFETEATVTISFTWWYDSERTKILII